MAPLELCGVSSRFRRRPVRGTEDIRIQRDGNLGGDLARRGIGHLDDAVGACREQRGAVDAVAKRAAAALVPPRAPDAVYGAKAILRGERRVVVAVAIVVVVVVACARRQAVRVDIAVGQAYCDERLLGMDGLHEDVVVYGESAEVLEHGGDWQ